MQKKRDDMALAMARLKFDLTLHLLETFGSATAVLDATPEEREERAELSPAVSRKLNAAALRQEADKELAFTEKYGIRVLSFDDPGFPPLLRECPDAPSLLYVKGDIDFSDPRKWIAVVGTRRATPYGAAACEQFIARLAETHPDTVIVSGLAYGIDSVTHRAALKCGLKTVAVVAHGLDTIQPAPNRSLAKEILACGGAVVSDYPSGSHIFRHNFLERNRIVAGMCAATIVAESPKKGGSLVTADIADSYSRDVFAFPGRLTDESFEGNLQLLKSNKAYLLTDPSDLEYTLGWEKAPDEFELFPPPLSGDEAKIYECLSGNQEYTSDELIEKSGIPAGLFFAAVTGLEVKGILKSVRGKMYVKIR